MPPAKPKILPHTTASHLPPGGIWIFVASVIVLQALFFLLHYMIYETLVAAFGASALPLGIPILFLSVTFITASILAVRFDGLLMRFYYRLAGIWTSFIGPFCGASAGFVLLECVLPFIGIDVPPEAAGIFLFGVAAAVTFYGMWNGTRAEITRITVPLPNLPDRWQGKKIAFFSDLHLGAFWNRGFAAKVAKKINAIRPEAIFMGGDLFDGVKCDTDRVLEPFKEMHPPLGVFYITGNHEYIRDPENFIGAVRRLGWKILENEKIDLQGIELAGVDYKDTVQKEPYAAILEQMAIDRNRPSILLKHVPEFLGPAEAAGISLVLSGHTHHGQFWPISLITRRVYAGYDYGLKWFKRMVVYTSSGVGGWMSPFRLGTKSEIVEITLQRAGGD